MVSRDQRGFPWNDEEYTKLAHACVEGTLADLKEVLKTYKTNREPPTKALFAVLYASTLSASDKIQRINALKKARPNQHDGCYLGLADVDTGLLPIHVAVAQNSKELFDILYYDTLSKLLTVIGKDTVLHVACQHGALEIVQHLQVYGLPTSTLLVFTLIYHISYSTPQNYIRFHIDNRGYLNDNRGYRNDTRKYRGTLIIAYNDVIVPITGTSKAITVVFAPIIGTLGPIVGK
jgi:hypothetical protein